MLNYLYSPRGEYVISLNRQCRYVGSEIKTHCVITVFYGGEHLTSGSHVGDITIWCAHLRVNYLDTGCLWINYIDTDFGQTFMLYGFSCNSILCRDEVGCLIYTKLW